MNATRDARLLRRGVFHVKHIPIRLVITGFDPVIQATVLPVAAFMDCRV
jgi:hypothetical protein